MKVRFHMNDGFVGTDREEIVTYDDDTPEETIERDLADWVWEHIDCHWEKEGD